MVPSRGMYPGGQRGAPTRVPGRVYIGYCTACQGTREGIYRVPGRVPGRQRRCPGGSQGGREGVQEGPREAGRVSRRVSEGLREAVQKRRKAEKRRSREAQKRRKDCSKTVLSLFSARPRVSVLSSLSLLVGTHSVPRLPDPRSGSLRPSLTPSSFRSGTETLREVPLSSSLMPAEAPLPVFNAGRGSSSCL